MNNNGLSTYTALRILNDEMKSILKRNFLKRKLFYYFKLSFNKGIMKNILVTNIVVLFLVTVETGYSLGVSELNYFWLCILYINVLIVLLINSILISLSTKSKYTSIFHKFQQSIDDIQHIMDSDCKGWTNCDNYPFIRIPFAHGVNLQWTIRDGHLINVPVALLVKGDVIKLRPGQYIYANCEINEVDCRSNDYLKTYIIGQSFISKSKDEKTEKVHLSDQTHLKLIPMKRCVTATVTHTPVLSLLEEYLVNYSLKDAWSVSVPERYIEFSLNCMLIYVIVLYILYLLIQVTWYILVGQYHKVTWPSSTSYIILIGVPFQIPFLLLLTMSNNVWKIICFLHKMDRRANISTNIGSFERIPSSISSVSSNDSNYSKRIDVTMDSMCNNKLQYFRAIWKQFLNQDIQFQKMIFNLGSLTSLCCVDKKGILADPIVTPEKIFIYRKKHRHRSNSLINLDKVNKKGGHIHSHEMHTSTTSYMDNVTNVRIRSLTAEDTFNVFSGNTNNINNGCSIKGTSGSPSIFHQKLITLSHLDSSLAIPVILDMTSSAIDPQLPAFDDNRWERYLSSLKPIGINILLNNCNPDVSDRYINFTDNMSAINFKNSNKSQLIHRCFCGLASQIGFKEGAADPYQLVTTFAACRQNNNQAQRSLDIDVNQVYQPPVSNVLSTVVRDRIKNSYQLMSQGSADMLLSMCSNYWDGKDISPLTRYDRSRVLDFYKRNIFSSYCIAFAYSPLINKIHLNEMGDQYILLMPEVKDPCKHFESKIDAIDKKIHRDNSSFHKIPLEKIQMDYFQESCVKNNKLSFTKNLEDVENLLNNQIFLGMVSMQADQVQSDVIDCINRLEQACIRFVFFSVDNQLRSRVFAERLGMESGWNCHISLADPSVIRRKSSSGIEKFNMKQIKHSYDIEMMSKDELCYRMLSYSEPILHRPQLESDQIAHSTTLPDSELSIIPKLNVNETEDMKRREYRSSSQTNSTSSSNSDSLKERDTFIEDPQDHFREDKSKLPCGIMSIRPHLENIDNVPLQVSLFTDCNPEVDQKMMDIMREYGEVICCCGSSLSLQNIPLFSSCDCAVAFIPILHKKCSRLRDNTCPDEAILSKNCQDSKIQGDIITEEEHLIKRKSVIMDHNAGLPMLSPINIASRLIGMPCGLIFDRTKGFYLITFITECHRLIKNSLSTIAFYCLSCVSFSLLKLVITVFVIFFDYYYTNTGFFIGLDFFPREAQIIYHFYFHSPVLALIIYTKIEMIGKPLKEPPRKRVRILTFKQCKRFIFASSGRFIPSVIICSLIFLWNLLILYPRPKDEKFLVNSTSDSYIEAGNVIPRVLGDFTFVQFNLYLIISSFFYMTFDKSFWKFNCLKNFLWPIITCILTVIQFLYLVCSWYFGRYSELYLLNCTKLFFPILASFCGSLVVLVVGFISNKWEAKALSVEHRLARLYFGTKLGMYSPV